MLIVDDEANQRSAVSRMVERWGFIVETAADGQEALDKLPLFTPHAIVTDVMMPGMDGIATLGALRANPVTAHVPVVFMTARSQPAEIARYRSLGALDVITKPFDPLVLAEQVRAIWQRAHVES